MMKALLVGLALTVTSLCSAAVPDPPKGVVGARKYATDLYDCNGAVAFSSSGAIAPTQANGGKLGYRKALIDKSIGWDRESGEFTCHCPGLYQFTFSGSGKTAETRFVLKEKLSSASTWTSVVSTAGGGGANIVLLEMDIGDKAGIWLEGGALSPESETAPVSTFSGIRIAKKN